MRVFVPGEGGARELFALAAAERRAGAPPAAERADARGRLRAARWERSSRADHDADSRSGLSTLRRRQRAARARAWLSSRGRHPHAARPSGRSSACCWSPGFRSSSAPCRSTPRPTCRRRRFSRRRPRRSGSSSSQQEIFVFFITVYVGAGLIANDRRANALQIYLSKPLTRAEYVFGKLAILMAFLLLVTWVPAIVLLIVQILVRRQLHVLPGTTSSCFRRSPCSRSSRSTVVATAMLALSSLSKSSRYVGILYAALIFFTQAIYGVLYAVTAQHGAVVDLVAGQPRRRSATSSSGCRCGTTRRGRCRC